MILLSVSFSEKDQAKALGARWSQEKRSWYMPDHLSDDERKGLSKWLPGEESAISEIIGEDRSFLGTSLFVDLIPSSCWFKNVRHSVTPESWDSLRKIIYARANYKCEICGAEKNTQIQRYIEAHERWSYDDQSGVQKLQRLIALCSDCHTVTHIGLAKIRGLGDEALCHLMKVTGMSHREAETHVLEAFRIWGIRSEKEYRLDLSILTDSKIQLLN